MLNTSLYVNEKVLTGASEKTGIRDGFGSGLVDAGKEHENVVGLCCDLTGSVRMDGFAEEFPERFVQIGVAEQNLASVASGMAAMGKIPFAASYAMFNPGRNWEQIRTTICYNDVPVKIVGGHAGISVAQDGGTHQAIEDIAIMRVLPNMDVIVPCDMHQAYKATLAIARTNKPSYIRLEKQKTLEVTTPETPFEIGKAQILFNAEKKTAPYALIACGSLVATALQVAQKLQSEGVEVIVVNLHTIKPLDTDMLDQISKKVTKIFTLEEHQRAGGMGSAVAEYVSEHACIPVYRMGIDDAYGESGTAQELLAKHGLDTESVYSYIKSKK